MLLPRDRDNRAKDKRTIDFAGLSARLIVALLELSPMSSVSLLELDRDWAQCGAVQCVLQVPASLQCSEHGSAQHSHGTAGVGSFQAGCHFGLEKLFVPSFGGDGMGCRGHGRAHGWV